MDEDTQQHLLVCEELKETDALVSEVPLYEHLFGNDLEKKLNISRILKSKMKERKKILEWKETHTLLWTKWSYYSGL